MSEQDPRKWGFGENGQRLAVVEARLVKPEVLTRDDFPEVGYYMDKFVFRWSDYVVNVPRGRSDHQRYFFHTDDVGKLHLLDGERRPGDKECGDLVGLGATYIHDIRKVDRGVTYFLRSNKRIEAVSHGYDSYGLEYEEWYRLQPIGLKPRTAANMNDDYWFRHSVRELRRVVDRAVNECGVEVVRLSKQDYEERLRQLAGKRR